MTVIVKMLGKMTNLHLRHIRVRRSVSTALPRQLRFGLAQVLASGVESLLGHFEEIDVVCRQIEWMCRRKKEELA